MHCILFVLSTSLDFGQRVLDIPSELAHQLSSYAEQVQNYSPCQLTGAHLVSTTVTLLWILPLSSRFEAFGVSLAACWEAESYS